MNKPTSVNVGPSTNKGVALSYSSMKELQSCEQRYVHRKVWSTPVDSDYVESDSLGLGKAFHQVLEHTLHKSWNHDLCNKAMSDNKVDIEDAPLLEIMLNKYVEFRKATGIIILKCEFGIQTPEYTGFIDAIGVDAKAKLWWLIDLKTTSRHDPNLIPQLSKDMQVGLYSHFVPYIEEHHPELAGYKFGGFKYCQTVKSKATTVKGLESGVKVYEMTIPAGLIVSGEAWSHFKEIHHRAVELNNGEAPKKNYSSCFSYFSSCPYFSKCHGVEFSKGADKIIVQTIDTIKSGDLL